MLLTLSGIVMLVKEEQPEKAPSPMLLTLFGIVMLFRDLQPAKALLPILLTSLSPRIDGMVSAPDGLGQTFFIVTEVFSSVYFQV